MLDHRGRVVMVSGAARGIGRAILEELREQGCLISAGIRDPAGLRADGSLMLHRYDAESLPAAEAWLAATLARFGRLDALVNAAGICPVHRLEDADETALDQMLSINVKAPARLIRLALPALRASGTGRVVNVASLSGKRLRNENLGYAMSKFAMMALTASVRREGRDAGIRATALCPGFVATDMTAHVTRVPRDRMTDPKDLAVLVATVMALPNTASVAELLVNWGHEDMV